MKPYKLHKDVTHLSCLGWYLNKDHNLPLGTEGFMYMNKHGWGYCKSCFEIVKQRDERR